MATTADGVTVVVDDDDDDDDVVEVVVPDDVDVVECAEMFVDVLVSSTEEQLYNSTYSLIFLFFSSHSFTISASSWVIDSKI